MDAKRLARIVGLSLIGVLFAGFSWIWFAPCALGGCVPLDDLARFEAEGSELLDINEEPFAHLATVNRRIVPLDSLPPHIPQAFLAIEDQRFYDHQGIDLWRTAGALWKNLRSGGVEEGGSTITQQLARNLFPEWLPYQERNIRRKVLEARVARQIERTFPKEKILELYLNHIYLGSGAYGVEAAARTYFGKSAAELSLAEAATLAALPQAPSRVNPKQDAEGAIRRRNLVLQQMVEAGFVTEAEASAAREEPLAEASADGEEESGIKAAYFVEQVRRELEQVIGNRFYTAGLRIHTTLDSDIQAAAEAELENQLRAVESGRYGTFRHPTYSAMEEDQSAEYLQGAVVVLDANTGEVRALVGGRDYSQSKFDRATQALRQPGSAFKPFIYATALEYYRSPAETVEDTPLQVTLTGGRVWEPRNYADSYGGTVTLREALIHSRNAATVRIAQQIGLQPTIRLAHELGISTELPDLPSTALGAAEVRPIELVAAYAAFANGGSRVEPYLIRRVVDRNGQVVWESRPRTRQVLDPAVAYVLTTMLQDVVDRGTGTAVRAAGFRAPAAGKTGTTNNSTDVWFVGYTPELVAGIWIGFDDPKPIIRGASGGTLAAPTWGRMMRRIYESRPAPSDWRVPPGVVTAEVDRLTGARFNPDCPVHGPVYTEYFIRYTPPAASCPDRYDLPYAFQDTIYDSWDEFGVYDSVYGDSIGSATSDWPELDELRRRARDARERAVNEMRAARGLDSVDGSDPADSSLREAPVDTVRNTVPLDGPEEGDQSLPLSNRGFPEGDPSGPGAEEPVPDEADTNAEFPEIPPLDVPIDIPAP